MNKVFSVLILALVVSCSTPKKKVSKDLDGMVLVNPQDGMQVKLQYDYDKRAYGYVLPDTVCTSDSTFYLVYRTNK